MSKKTMLMVAGIGVLCAGLVAGCVKKKDAPDKPDPKPTKPQVMQPAPDAGMRPEPARPNPGKVAKAPLGCDLSADKAHKAGQPVTVTWKLTNRSGAPVRVLGWQTPLDMSGDKLIGAPFKVSRDGKPVAYNGAKVKRGDPAAKDYQTVAAGKALVKTFDLAKSYDLSKPGKYTVTLNRPLMDVVSDAKIKIPRAHAQQKATKLTAAPLIITIAAK